MELQRSGSAGAAWLDIQPENRVLACQVITSRHVTHIMPHHLVAHDVLDHTRYHIILHCITSRHVPDHTSHNMSLHSSATSQL